MTVTLSSPKTMPPPTGYSQIAEVTKGKLVLIAGQVAHDTSGNLVGENDFGAQVEQVFKNLDAAVRAAGGTFKDIVKINNYCVASVDPAALAAFREVRDRYVNTKAPPVSTFVFVSRLVRPGWLFEIDAMAVIDLSCLLSSRVFGGGYRRARAAVASSQNHDLKIQTRRCAVPLPSAPPMTGEWGKIMTRSRRHPSS